MCFDLPHSMVSSEKIGSLVSKYSCIFSWVFIICTADWLGDPEETLMIRYRWSQHNDVPLNAVVLHVVSVSCLNSRVRALICRVFALQCPLRDWSCDATYPPGRRHTVIAWVQWHDGHEQPNVHVLRRYRSTRPAATVWYTHRVWQRLLWFLVIDFLMNICSF